jgi:UDP-N-acetylglucosamine transferase subunit ALG13
MVFVTIGSSHFGFTRLIAEVDRLAGMGILSDVTAQIGETDYEPRNCRWQRFLTPTQMRAEMAGADFVICHAGCGTLEDGLRARKKMIVMPRLARRKEVPDDHQWEIARLLAAHDRILLANETDELVSCITSVATWSPCFAPPRVGNPVVEYVVEFIAQVGASQRRSRLHGLGAQVGAFPTSSPLTSR